jgi:hypothetical protein
MDSDTLGNRKRHLKELSDYAMSEIAIQFVTKIIDDFEGAKVITNNFREIYKPEGWCDTSTRVANQIMVISLVENLFCHYMCNDDQEKSGHDKLLQALEKNGRSQIDILRQKQRNDQVRPAIFTLYEMIQEGEECEEIKIVRHEEEYHPEMGTSAYHRKDVWTDYFYITGDALQGAFTKRLGRLISFKKLSGEFHDAGILVEDLDKHTKKFHDKRHYVINVKTLETIVKTIGY